MHQRQFPRRSRRAVALVAAAAIAVAGSATATYAAAPAVTVARIGGSAVNGDEAKKPVGAPTVSVGGTADTVSSFTVDAGDSPFVEVGGAVALRGYTVGGHGLATYAWSFDGAADRFGDPTAAATSFDTTGLEAGTHVVRLTAEDASSRITTDTVHVVLYRSRTTPVLETGPVEAGPGVPDEFLEGGDAAFLAGLVGAETPETSGAVDRESTSYEFTVPTNATKLEAWLSWDDPTNDFDLEFDDPADVHDENGDAATGVQPEHAVIEGPAAGAWAVTTHAFLVTQDAYELTVEVTDRPADPRPTIDAPPVFTFDVGEPQNLHVDVFGASPDAVEWDLDNDGAFDARGTDVVAHAPAGTTLVTVKATDTDGLEQRVMVGLRVSLGETQTSPLVVVGVVDSGLNLYHEDFGAALYPDESVLELTKDFTRHPAEYITGYPATTPALPITLGKGYLPPEDADLFARENVPLGQLFWVPGTKVIGVRDGGDTDTATDTVPLLDENSHGTRSASVAVGNIFGYCPTCLLVFSEDINGDVDWAFDQPWIDIVSNSYGMESGLGSAGLPVADAVFADGQPKAAAERGQLALYAAGNGVQRFFIAPNQTYTSDLMSADWRIRVGAVDHETNKPIFGSGHPVDVSSYGFGYVPAADITGTSAAKHNAIHGGTSAATPYTAGAFGHVLAAVRGALRDADEGQRDSGAGVIAEGVPIVGSPYLADGKLTRAELTEVVFKTAAHDPSRRFYADYNARVAASAPVVELALEGYGVVNQSTAAHAIDVLLGRQELPDRAAEDAFMAADTALREALWGTWGGGGENSAALATRSLTTPARNPFVGVTTDDVATFSDAISLIDDRAGPFADTSRVLAAEGMAEGDALTYYLHLTGSCSDGANSMNLANSEGDVEPCTLIGGGLPIVSIDYPAEAPVPASVPAGTPVSGVVYLQTTDPAFVTVTATLSSGSTTVGSGTSDAVITTGAADGVAGLWHQLPVAFTTTADVVPGAPLAVSLALDTAAGVDIGYEGDHASLFTLVGIGGGGGTGGEPVGGDDHPVAGGYAATITNPIDGATVDGAGATIAIAGSSTLPLRTAASAGINRFYPHWTEDAAGNCGDTSLDRNPAVADSGCRSTLQGAAVTGATGDALVADLEIRESYPLVAPELPVTLGEGSATGTLFYRGDLQRVQDVTVPGVSPAHRVTVELRATHLGLVHVIGRQTIDGTILTDATAFNFDVPIPTSFAGKPFSALSLDVVTEQSTALAAMERQDPQSFVDLPVAPTGEGVYVSIDDPTFVRPVVASRAADGSWGVNAPTSVLTSGTHTVYAKVVRGLAQSAVVSRTFSVTRPAASDVVEVQAVPAGNLVSSAGWVRAVDTSGSKTFESWTADLGNLPKGRYELYARLRQSGAVTATTGPISFRRV